MKRALKRILALTLVLTLFTVGMSWAKYTQTLTDTFQLNVIGKAIQFGTATDNCKAQYTSNEDGTYAFKPTLFGNGYERVFIPIENLAIGSEYTISFDFYINGQYRNHGLGRLGYKVIDEDWKTKLSPIGVDCASKGFTITDIISSANDGAITQTVSCSGSFTATANKMYLMVEMSDTYDGSACDVQIYNLSVEKGSSAASVNELQTMNSPTVITLNPGNPFSIAMDTFEDVYPVGGLQQPMAGQDFGYIFEPLEGYRMDETITVTITNADGAGSTADTVYTVYTDGQEHRDGENLPPMPTFDPAGNTLTIPAVLLTEETQSITIAASAVEIIEESITEPTTEPTEEPTEEPTTEPTTEPTEEPTEPATETVEGTTEPDAEPAMEPAAEPSAEPPMESPAAPEDASETLDTVEPEETAPSEQSEMESPTES